jgi:hypothetical protein
MLAKLPYSVVKKSFVVKEATNILTKISTQQLLSFNGPVKAGLG